MPAVIEASARDFESTLASQRGPVLVDFTASWCGPCKMMAPALESFAERRRSALAVVKVDIDEAPDVAAKYGIGSVPTLMLLDNGRTLAQRSGMMSESQLAQFVDRALPSPERATVEQDPTRAQIDLDW
jgi:thioredoxin 1